MDTIRGLLCPDAIRFRVNVAWVEAMVRDETGTHNFEVTTLVRSLFRTWKRSFQMERILIDEVNPYV